MDNGLLGTIIAIVKAILSTAVSDALAAAERAEDAAELAEQHNMGVAVNGTTIVFSEEA